MLPFSLWCATPLLKPLVNRDEDRLIRIRQSAPGIGDENTTFSVPEMQDLRSRVNAVVGHGEVGRLRSAIEELSERICEYNDRIEGLAQASYPHDHVDIRAKVYGIQNVFSPQDANMTYTFTVYTISVDPVQTPTTTTETDITLFLTAREVSSC